jgi:hypothetical protein
VSQLDRDVREALQRGQSNDLGVARSRYRREPDPLPDPPGWGPLTFLKPPTPWHLVGLGVLLYFVGQLLGRAALAGPLAAIGIALAVVGVLSLLLLPRSQPKRWRGRLINLDDSWQARLYRQLYKR